MSDGSLWLLIWLRKKCYLLRSYVGGVRRGKTALYAWASISAIEEAWLMLYADGQCTLVGREEFPTGRENFMFNSCLSYLKIWIFISSRRNSKKYILFYRVKLQFSLVVKFLAFAQYSWTSILLSKHANKYFLSNMPQPLSHAITHIRPCIQNVPLSLFRFKPYPSFKSQFTFLGSSLSSSTGSNDQISSSPSFIWISSSLSRPLSVPGIYKYI